MAVQLIINILGDNSLKSLGKITGCICNQNCNILDSRYVEFGTDFSLTMIAVGKQNIEQVVTLTFSGDDTSGVMYKVMQMLSEYNVAVSAIRQYISNTAKGDELTSKMILSAAKTLNLDDFDRSIKRVLSTLGLHEKISHSKKENHEYIESW